MKIFILMLLLIFSTIVNATSTNYGDLTVTGSLSITTVATDSVQNDVLFQAVTGEIRKFTLPSFAELDSSPTFTGTVSALAFEGDGSGLTGISTVAALVDLTDTNITSEATNETLHYDGSKWVNRDTQTSDVKTAVIGTPTYDDLKELINNTLNAGLVTDGACSDNGDGTIAVSAIEGLIKATNTATAELLSFSLSASASVVLTDASDNYIYVDYNSGTPILATIANGETIRNNERDKFEICEVYKDGTTLHVTPHAQISGELGRLLQQRLYEEEPVRRTGGMILSETATRNIVVTSGAFWTKATKGTTAAIDTSAASTFTSYYQDGGTGWTASPSQTQWQNTQYDNGSGTLQDMIVGRYACNYFWMETDGDLSMVYPQAQYVGLAAAETADVPSPPPILADHGIFIAKLCFQTNDATASTITNPFGTNTTYASMSDYNNLSNLPDLTVYSLTDGSRNFTGDLTLEQGLTVTSTLTLSNAPLVAAQSNYLTLVGGEVKQAPITPSTTGTLSSTSLTVVGGVGATNSDATVDVATANYTTAGIITSTKYGDFDTSNTDKYGYRNAEDNSLSSWDVTGLSTASLTINATTPLFGAYDYKLSNVTGSASESACTTSIAIPNGSAGRSHGMTFNYSYDGADNDIRVEFVDVTNTATIDYVLLPAGTNQKKMLLGFTNSTTANVKACFIINTVNNGKFLNSDNVKFEVDPQKTVELIDEQVYKISQGVSSFTNYGGELEYNLATATISNIGNTIIYAADDSANTRTKFIALKKCRVGITASGESYAGNLLVIYKNGVNTGIRGTHASGNDTNSLVSGFIDLNAGEYFTIYATSAYPAAEPLTTTFHAFAQSEGVVHSDTYPENVFGANIAADAVVSNENDNFITTCTDADPRVCTLVTGFFTVAPRCWASPTAGTAIVTASSTTEVTIDTTDANTAFGLFCQRQGTDYKPLTGTVITPVTQTCYLKDLRTSGTSAGTSTSNTVHTRILNSLQGDCSFVTLAGGTTGVGGTATQFIVSPGKYKIKAWAPALETSQSQAFIYSVTGTAYVLEGRSLYDVSETNFDATVNGLLTPSVATTYELRHWIAVGRATNGLGTAADTHSSNPQTTESYSMVEIEKLK